MEQRNWEPRGGRLMFVTVEVTVDVTGTEDPGEARMGRGTPEGRGVSSTGGRLRGRGWGHRSS